MVVEVARKARAEVKSCDFIATDLVNAAECLKRLMIWL